LWYAIARPAATAAAHMRRRRASSRRGRGRLLEDLLVAALHRALALEAVEERPVRVAEDLDLDVRGAVT
jgi:hypothetical protein